MASIALPQFPQPTLVFRIFVHFSSVLRPQLPVASPARIQAVGRLLRKTARRSPAEVFGSPDSERV